MHFSISTLFMLTVLVAVANKHMVDILINGSIFDSLRQFIKDRSRGSWLFEKLNQLFSCPLCMSTQVGLWVFSLPVSWFWSGTLVELLFPGASWWLLLVLVPLVWFEIGMYVGGSTMILWRVSEHLPERNRILEEQNEELLALAAAGGQAGGKAVLMTPDQFESILMVIAETCADIGCPIKRKSCIRRVVREELQETMSMVRALKAAERMQEVLNHYLQRIRRKGSGERQAAREEIYAQLVEQKLAQPA